MQAPDYFKYHEEEDTRRFGEIYSDTQEIKGDIKTIKENHLAHIEPAVVKISTDMVWIKWLLMGMVAGMGGVLGYLISLKLSS
jgi:hypothetical protein